MATPDKMIDDIKGEKVPLNWQFDVTFVKTIKCLSTLVTGCGSFPRVSSMLSLRNHLISVSGIAVLLLSSFLLLSVTPWQVPHRVQTSLDAAFTSQFDGLQRLVLSLLQSQSQVQSLRVDSVALEDLSYALTVTPQGFPDDDVRQRIHTLSQEVAAVAALVQRLYVEVDVFVHL